MLLIAAVTAALAGALTYGLSAVLEQRSVSQVAERGVFAPRLLVDLARRPLWLASVAATLVGAAMQAIALHFGPLALVQPILACDLLFAVLINAAARRAAPDAVLFAGSVCCAAGLGVFLAVAEPTGGTETVSLPAVIPLAAGLAAVLAGCLAWARAGSRTTRALALALACGVCYGVNAFLLKLVTFSLAQGFSEPLQQWPLYTLVVVGPVGFLLNQEAFQSGRLVSPALAVITTTTALVSIGIGYLWLDETFANGPAAVVTEVVSLAVMTAGIVLLANRAPVVARRRAATAGPASAGAASTGAAGAGPTGAGPAGVGQAEPAGVNQAEPATVNQAEAAAVDQAEPGGVGQAGPAGLSQAKAAGPNQAGPPREARGDGHRVAEQHHTGRGDDVEQVVVRGRDHVDRRGGRIEPGCRA